jgi:putative hemolysin
MGILAVVDLPWTNLAFRGLALLLLLALSAVFSGSETVLFSLTPVQLERAANHSSRLRRLAAELLRQPKQILLTILVGNTAVNLLFFSSAYVLFDQLAQHVGRWLTPLASVATVLLVVVLGEVTPKVLAVRLADRLVPAAALAMRTANVVAGPIGRVIDRFLAVPFERLLLGTSPGSESHASLSGAELKALLELSRRGGTLLPLEDTFLRAVIDLAHLRVRDVMVPRVEMAAYDVSGSADGLRAYMRQTRHKKIPVFSGVRDRIVGMVYAKVLFLNPGKALRELVQPVRFVPELITCEQLLIHFRGTRSQLAIAVDEYGGVAGLVTLEDVLEQIVGELHDPEDRPTEPEIQALADGEYEISGQLSIHYWVEAFRLPARVERVATVGGLVMSVLGRPARVGDVVPLGNIELRVVRMRGRRVERLRLQLLDGGAPAEEDAS